MTFQQTNAWSRFISVDDDVVQESTMLPPFQSHKPKAIRPRDVRRLGSTTEVKSSIRGQRIELKAPLKIGGADETLAHDGSS
jgi:hypothetical protein